MGIHFPRIKTKTKIVFTSFHYIHLIYTAVYAIRLETGRTSFSRESIEKEEEEQETL
jgi:hypothetical protein